MVTYQAKQCQFVVIGLALRRYEALRLPRASRIQAMSAENKTRFHLHDGPEQQERDARMAGGSTDFALKAVESIYSHDARAIEGAEAPARA